MHEHCHKPFPWHRLRPCSTLIVQWCQDWAPACGQSTPAPIHYCPVVAHTCCGKVLSPTADTLPAPVPKAGAEDGAPNAAVEVAAGAGAPKAGAAGAAGAPKAGAAVVAAPKAAGAAAVVAPKAGAVLPPKEKPPEDAAGAPKAGGRVAGRCGDQSGARAGGGAGCDCVLVTRAPVTY